MELIYDFSGSRVTTVGISGIMVYTRSSNKDIQYEKKFEKKKNDGRIRDGYPNRS